MLAGSVGPHLAGHQHRTGAVLGGDAVEDGVLHQRLEQQIGNTGLRRYPGPDRQPVGKPHLLDVDVALQKIHLLPYRHLLHPAVVERDAEQRAELGQERHRLVVALLPHQHRDGVHGVEQKMRMQLLLERLEFGLHQTRLQLHRLDLLVLVLAVDLEDIAAAQHRPVEHHVDEVAAKEVLLGQDPEIPE